MDRVCCQRRSQHNQDYVLKIAYRVGTLDEFRAMPAMEILRRRLAEAYRAQSPATRSRLIVTGSVPRDTEPEYVVIERRPDFEHAANMPPLRVDVMTLKNTEGVWQSMLDGGLQSGDRARSGELWTGASGMRSPDKRVQATRSKQRAPDAQRWAV